MKIDLLVAEIGSTTTIINAFDKVDGKAPVLIGSGYAPTSVLAGNVLEGLHGALEMLEQKVGEKIQYRDMLATSSAAGGLKMTVHGLVYDMTVRAAREAALGAGAIIKHATAGKLTEYDIEDIRRISPNLILLAGGTDFGERETAVFNAKKLLEAEPLPPVIYAGNIQCVRQIKEMFDKAGKTLYVTENVYPRLDELNVEPTRRIIHEVFTRHITEAPGMEHVREMVNGDIIPTPGAVLSAAKLLYEKEGDCVVLDVGGATTDVHSATAGSDEIAAISISPEPLFKRTVEGDLGVYVNAVNVFNAVGGEELSHRLNIDACKTLARLSPIPAEHDEILLAGELAYEAGRMAILRHAGRLRDIFGASGRKKYAEGKDLSKIKYLVATGGALTKLKGRENIMNRLAALNGDGKLLFPDAKSLRVLYDDDYILAAVGVMSASYPEAAEALMRKSLGL